MAPALVALLGAVMLGTACLSGIFGMAGGMILMGVLLAVMSVPDAMALHGVTQMASNASRGLSWLAPCATARRGRVPVRLRDRVPCLGLLALRPAQASGAGLSGGHAVPVDRCSKQAAP